MFSNAYEIKKYSPKVTGKIQEGRFKTSKIYTSFSYLRKKKNPGKSRDMHQNPKIRVLSWRCLKKRRAAHINGDKKPTWKPVKPSTCPLYVLAVPSNFYTAFPRKITWFIFMTRKLVQTQGGQASVRLRSIASLWFHLSSGREWISPGNRIINYGANPFRTSSVSGTALRKTLAASVLDDLEFSN